MGILNAAVWLGAAIFFILGVAPASSSEEIKELLGEKNAPFFPYFSGAIRQILCERLIHLQLGCAAVALIHLAAERLYFGQPPRRIWFGILAGLFIWGLAGTCWVQPWLKQWHSIRYSVRASQENRALAAESFRTWQNISEAINLLAIAGLTFYVRHLANPPITGRFLDAGKFPS